MNTVAKPQRIFDILRNAIFGVLASLLGLVTPTGQAQDLGRLPEQIPSMEVSVVDAMKEAARAVRYVEPSKERQRVVTRMLHYSHGVRSAYLEPIVDSFEEVLESLDDKRDMRSSGEALHHLAPRRFDQFCRQIEDPRTRDQCRRDYVRHSHYRRPAELRPLIDEIQGLKYRQDCFERLLSNRRSTLEEARVFLHEWRKLGTGQPRFEDPIAVMLGIARTGQHQLDELDAFLRAEFRPEEAVECLARAAAHWEVVSGAPLMASEFHVRAVGLLASCPDQAVVADLLLATGLARHQPKLAAELFDEHIETKLHRLNSASLLSKLAYPTVNEALVRADDVARRLKIASDQLKSEIVGRYFVTRPEQAMEWLRNTPASALRDGAVSEIVSKLADVPRSHKREGANHPENVRRRLDELTKFAIEIEDLKLRGAALRRLAAGYRRWSGQSRSVPAAIRDEFVRIWPSLQIEMTSDLHVRRLLYDMDLLPEDVQLSIIREKWATNDIRSTAAFLRYSSLRRELKAIWYRELLASTRNLSDQNVQSTAYSALAVCIWEIDVDWALEVAWKGLRIAQELGLEPQTHDVGDLFGNIRPITTADALLGRFFGEPTFASDSTLDSLWSFARALDRAAEREAVLERIVKLLLQRGDVHRAAGVASLITTSERRAKIWHGVAVVSHGHLLLADW